MSVYTELSQQDIEQLLGLYDLGAYKNHKGISAGVENTNYFVSTDQHELVLTLFEKHSADELPFFLQLGEHLHQHGCMVPQPFRNLSGQFLQIVKNKPAVFVERVRGGHVEATLENSVEIAKALANVHLATEHFSGAQPHTHGRQWLSTNEQNVKTILNDADGRTLARALHVINRIPNDLPKGVIHADLFHDNALFDAEKITGIIDWYFAGVDDYALDIAITMNDWCLKQNQFDLNQGEAFVAAYQEVRPLLDAEINALPALQIQSATRFWMSRILAKAEHQASDDKITVKDPDEMKALLIQLLNYTE